MNGDSGGDDDAESVGADTKEAEDDPDLRLRDPDDSNFWSEKQPNVYVRRFSKCSMWSGGGGGRRCEYYGTG
ncbi:hypothetical protein D9615_007887 [Tricholomella constricta]|uniref:Uncharacterized protein n=1 Tax=Tricholomella constricta TaxID=117010 RepID=A0A8H5H4P8_9AGAR|nr:hypothetical protein D9615_007887 [Tricholomella constricta]